MIGEVCSHETKCSGACLLRPGRKHQGRESSFVWRDRGFPDGIGLARDGIEELFYFF